MIKRNELFPDIKNEVSKKSIINSRFEKLEYSGELENPENIDKIVSWFKKETDRLLNNEVAYNSQFEPESTIEELAAYLGTVKGKNVGKKVRESIQRYGERTEYWENDRKIPSEEVLQWKQLLIDTGMDDDIIDYEYTYGELNWLGEHILEYFYSHDDRPESSFKVRVEKWNDDALQKAIIKWLNYLDALQP